MARTKAPAKPAAAVIAQVCAGCKFYEPTSGDQGWCTIKLPPKYRINVDYRLFLMNGGDYCDLFKPNQ